MEKPPAERNGLPKQQETGNFHKKKTGITKKNAWDKEGSLTGLEYGCQKTRIQARSLPLQRRIRPGL